MSRRCLYCLPVSLLLFAAAASPAPAATQNWGDFVGDTVTYLQVTEANGEANLLFSQPSVVGDTLKVDPVNFFSEAGGGVGADIVDSELNMTVVGKPGFFIQNMQISEAGDFTLIGAPGALAQAQVGASLFFEVLEVDGVAVGGGPSGSVNMQVTTGSGPNGGIYSLPGDSGTNVIWQGTAFLDIAAAMAASPFAGQNATRVRVEYENTLSTFAGANAASFIKKKVISGLTIQTNIPEPGSVALALVACIPLVVVAARRRK
jgi:hypothetical protein